MANAHRTATCLVVFALMFAATIAKAQSPAPDRQVSPTRGVVVFSRLEQQLADATASGDPAAIDRLLAGDFEQRNVAEPNRPLPRKQWLMQHRTGVHSFDGMTVHDYGTVAVASFVQIGVKAGQHTVIDIWRKNRGAWQLQLRFIGADAVVDSNGDHGIRPDGKG